MRWGSVARDNVQVEGVELIRCVKYPSSEEYCDDTDSTLQDEIKNKS